MARLVRVLASHGASAGVVVPPWEFRVAVYESTNDELAWTCPEAHSSAQEAKDCGERWLRQRTRVEQEESQTV